MLIHHSCVELAIDVWKVLKIRFSQADYFRIADLQEQIYSIRQGFRSITDYFTRLKALWDEYISMRPTPLCICEPVCKCAANQKALIYQEII